MDEGLKLESTTTTTVCLVELPKGAPKIGLSHIDASHPRQPLVKGERLVRDEVNAVIQRESTSTKV